MKDAREERGLAIAQLARIDRKDDGTWLVPSMSGNGRYTVNVDSAKPTCTCPDCEKGFKCKHIYAVEFYAKRETRYNTDGSVTVTETVAICATPKKTYKQDWPAYNAAQTTEKHHFQELLYDLCGGLEELPPSKGRPYSVPRSIHRTSWTWLRRWSRWRARCGGRERARITGSDRPHQLSLAERQERKNEHRNFNRVDGRYLEPSDRLHTRQRRL